MSSFEAVGDSHGAKPHLAEVYVDNRMDAIWCVSFFPHGNRTYNSETVQWTVSATSANTGGYLFISIPVRVTTA